MFSLVVPVFNEEESIQLFVRRVEPVLARLPEVTGAQTRAEIVFVDDSSTDGTAETIKRIEAPGCELLLVKLSRNFGKDAVLAAGPAHARGMQWDRWMSTCRTRRSSCHRWFRPGTGPPQPKERSTAMSHLHMTAPQSPGKKT